MVILRGVVRGTKNNTIELSLKGKKLEKLYALNVFIYQVLNLALLAVFFESESVHQKALIAGISCTVCQGDEAQMR